MEEIVLNWLQSGCDITTGVELLEKYANNALLVRLVKSNPAKNADLLINSLCKLANVERPKGSPSINRPAARESFREEFPFLEKSDCPLELKALVTDKFSSFYRYRKLHAHLSDCSNLVECANTARELISSYRENRAIYAELNYYKQHKTVLGKHPIFKHFHKLQELKTLKVKDLVKLQIKLNHNIWRINSEIEKGDKPQLNQSRLDSIEQKKSELAEVNRLLY
ncbi:MAG TPA: hypothetical protein VIK29_07670 [Paludibacter sp.]